jgi:quercetin dioxygenase-like cupin family protein
MVDLGQSAVFRYVDLPVRKMANGGESRDIVRGTLATGEVVGLHESTQVAGMVPNPAHPIAHTEFILVFEGNVEFNHDGKSERVGPGGILYVAKGTVHQVKNVGDGAARYCVVAIGGDVRGRD